MPAKFERAQLPPLSRHLTTHMEIVAERCRHAAANPSSDLRQLVQEYIGAEYLQSILAQTGRKRQTNAQNFLPKLDENRQQTQEDQPQTAHRQRSVEGPQPPDSANLPSISLQRRGRSCSQSSTSTCNDDELLSPCPDPALELEQELDRAIGCGDLRHINGLLQEVRRQPKLANLKNVARPLVALQCYASRLQQLSRDSLDANHNTFARV